MKPFEQDRVLNEILADEKLAELRRTSLLEGVKFLRRQRRHRFALRLGLPAAVIFLCGLGIWLSRDSGQARHHVAMVQLPEKSPPSPGLSAHVKYISDDELLALFPNRPVALIGKPGQQRLVFLGQTRP